MRKFQPRSVPLLTLALAGLLTFQTAQADVYRWTDAQGHVQYSDRPVPGAERISSATRIPGSSSSNEAAAAAAAAEREKLKVAQPQAQGPAAQAATQQTVAQDVAGARAEQCKVARTRYDKAIRARRMFRTNATGEREYLSDADADAARITAKTELDQACN